MAATLLDLLTLTNFIVDPYRVIHWENNDEGRELGDMPNEGRDDDGFDGVDPLITTGCEAGPSVPGEGDKPPLRLVGIEGPTSGALTIVIAMVVIAEVVIDIVDRGVPGEGVLEEENALAAHVMGEIMPEAKEAEVAARGVTIEEVIAWEEKVAILGGEILF